MKEKITIEDLYSDTGSFDEQAVLRTLKGKITFSTENAIQFAIDPSELTTREAILLYILAKKALKVNQKIDDETITSAEVTDKTKLNNNTVRGTISRLKENKLIMPSGTGYEIPTFKVAEVLKLLKDNGY